MMCAMKRIFALVLALALMAACLPAQVLAAEEEAAPVEETVTEPTTEEPIEEPTEAPAEEPTEAPTEEPTEAPAEESTEAPTEEATEELAEESGGETAPVTYAASGTCGDNLTWTLDDAGTFTVSGTGAMYDYNSSLEGNGNNAPWVGYKGSIKTIIIEDGVTSIGRYTFNHCQKLNEVTLGKDVTYIHPDAFYSSLIWNLNIKNLAAFCQIDFGYNSPARTATKLYVNGERVTDLVIPDGVTEIGDRVFFQCSALTSVTIPDSVVNIGQYAFAGCYGLTEIRIGDGVTGAISTQFDSCIDVTTVFIGKGISGIAYEEWNDLESIWIDEQNPYLSSDECGVLFNKDKTILIKCPYGYSGAYTIPDSVISVGADAFRSCDQLTGITLPGSATVIENSTFAGCNKLSAVYITDIAEWCRISFKDVYCSPLYKGAAL